MQVYQPLGKCEYYLKCEKFTTIKYSLEKKIVKEEEVS